MLRLEIRLVVILATLALLVVLVEWNVDRDTGDIDSGSTLRGFRASKELSPDHYRTPTSFEEPKRTPNTKDVVEVSYKFEPLPSNVVNAVDRFVFFVGYARSGHSIVASMLDAHPNVVIAHEYALFTKWSHNPSIYNSNKTSLFNALYNSSRYSAHVGLRHGETHVRKKGYSLEIPGWFQGSYQGGISVIGDKAGGMTAQVYRNSKKGFELVYKQIQRTTKIPLHAIHVIRNPYDNIATMLLYNQHAKNKVNETHKYSNVGSLHRQIVAYFNQVSSVLDMIKTNGLNSITIHHSDFIANPKATMRHLCQEISLMCSGRYLHMVAEHTFSSESHSRYLVEWTPELLDLVEENIAKYPLLKRYKFR